MATGRTQNRNTFSDWRAGSTATTYNGLPVNTVTPTAGGTTGSGTGVTRQRSTGGNGAQATRSGVAMPAATRTAAGVESVGNPSAWNRQRIAENAGRRDDAKSVWGFGAAGLEGALAGADIALDGAVRRGRGRGSEKPLLPEELANDIAAAYARMQGTGPEAYSDPYQAQIDAMRGRRYQDYDSRYIPQIDNLMDRLLNRDAFRYNWSDDPLYRQYAARYQQQARQGMQDTMGQAAALTGGYGSSYATAAGNQAYANVMDGLNDRAMELYQLAADRYDQEGADMRANLSALETREAQNRGNYESDRSTFYGREDADLANLMNSQSMDYQRYMDEVARDQYERELAWQMYQYWNNLAENNYRRA